MELPEAANTAPYKRAHRWNGPTGSKQGRRASTTVEQREQIIALRDQGKNFREISDLLGIPTSTVSRTHNRITNPLDDQERRSLLARLARYKLSVEQFEQMLLAQESACAICGRTNGRLVIDHDHKSNQVRGLLCGTCNPALGHFKDSVLNLSKAISYLERHRRKTDSPKDLLVGAL